jgi:hypothetical protein
VLLLYKGVLTSVDFSSQKGLRERRDGHFIEG